MRPLRSLIVYLLVVFIGGALLAPWLYWLTQSLAGTFPHLAESPFHRFVNRSLLGLALLGLWPLLRSLGLRRGADVGLVSPSSQGRRWTTGFALGFLSLACVAALALGFGARHFADELSAIQFGRQLFGAALTALVVSVLEEVLFRGALFGALRKAWSWPGALLVSSMVYAIVHFLESTKWTEPVTWLSGLAILPKMLRGFVDLHAVLPGFFNLTLAGAILAFAYQRTGNLYFSIGLHAGWIFWLKFYGAITRDSAGAPTWLWGTHKLIDGWLALPVLATTLFILVRRREANPQPHAD